MSAPKRYPGRLAALAALAAGALLGACGRHESPPAASAAPASAPAPAPMAQAANQIATPTPDAAAAAARSFTPTALDDLLAPIALYPDSLVGQILTASMNTQEVLDAGNWLLENQDLKNDELDAAAGKLGFSPAMRALVHFPTVVDMLCQELDWTRQLGEAFTADQDGVLDSIQRLRQQAAAVGNLKSTPQQKVQTESENGKQVIVVQPAEPTVVYVPQYNPQVVYTTPAPPPAQTTVVTESGHSDSDMLGAGLMGFTAGVLLTKAFDDDDYYYPHWGGGGAYYPPPYRPVYGPAFRPAGAYVRPPGYRYGYNNNNIVINNQNNYFNRFGDKTSNRVNATPARAANTRAGQDRNDWKGRSDYAGAKQTPRATDRSQPSRPDIRDPTSGQRTGEQRMGNSANRTDRVRMSGGDRGYERPEGPAPGAGSARPEPAAARPARDTGALGGVGEGDTTRAASRRGRESTANRQLPHQAARERKRR